METINLYFDTEFTGLHQATTLISLGIIAETGETFYAEFTDYDKSQCDNWIQENVIKKLKLTDKLKPGIVIYEEGCIKEGDKISGFKKDYECISSTTIIVDRLLIWLAQFDDVIMVADVLAYDWVLFCQLFSGSMNLPSNVHYIPIDLSTFLAMNGFDADIDRQSILNTSGYEKHNALNDAAMVKNIYEYLTINNFNITK